MTISVRRTTPSRATSQSQMPDVASAKKNAELMVKKGGLIEKKPDGYYLRADVQMSATKGAVSMKVDRELAEAILRATEDRGRATTVGDRASSQINAPEMQRIIKNVVDGGRYGEGEAALVRMLFAACDDRKNVRLNGKKLELTGPVDTRPNERTRHTSNAEYVVKNEMHKFWGSLGAKVRWSNPVVNAAAD